MKKLKNWRMRILFRIAKFTGYSNKLQKMKVTNKDVISIKNLQDVYENYSILGPPDLIRGFNSMKKETISK